jgi:hypothetical protein
MLKPATVLSPALVSKTAAGFRDSLDISHDHAAFAARHVLVGEEREATDQLKFMKRLPKWISERGWESYKDQVRDLESVNRNSSKGYGTEIE